MSNMEVALEEASASVLEKCGLAPLAPGSADSQMGAIDDGALSASGHDSDAERLATP